MFLTLNHICPNTIEVEAKAFESSLEFAKYMGVRFT